MNTLLLTAAAILGFLAFFEPCTIATHTLFAVRAHRGPKMQRIRVLTQLLLARTGLLVLIFGSAAMVGLDALPGSVAMILLGVIGLVYLVSRKVYLPVPHLEFFRLVPRHDALSQGYKLGLTLPACTLPLVLIVGVLAALVQQPAVAALAGVVFALMFTLPTLWSSASGVGQKAQIFLTITASSSPYLTTLLLWGSAFIIGKTGI